MLRFLLLTTALLTAAPLGAAMAQEPGDESEDQEARALFEAGRTAFEAGRFEAALRHFEASYELSGHPQLLYVMFTLAVRDFYGDVLDQPICVSIYHDNVIPSGTDCTGGDTSNDGQIEFIDALEHRTV